MIKPFEVGVDKESLCILSCKLWHPATKKVQTNEKSTPVKIPCHLMNSTIIN